MAKILEPIIHIFFWALILYITFINFGIKVQIINIGGETKYVKHFLSVFLILISIDLLFKAIMFYGNTKFLLPRLFKSKSKTQRIIEILSLFAITIVVSLVINLYIINSFFDFNLQKDTALTSYSLLLHIFFLLLSFGYFLAKDWYRNETIKREIIQEKLETELNFLKAQINPHFMFNTLNNLYSDARKNQDKIVANGIAKLSHIMRYMIYDSNVEFVSLDKEIHYLESFIELQKLRISEDDPFELVFNKENVDLTLKISPILFIPFVENAFKYGLSIDEKCFIHISIETYENKLFFKVLNSKFNTQSIKEHSGVGLVNVKRRLALLYPHKHHLELIDESKEYKVILELDLN